MPTKPLLEDVAARQKDSDGHGHGDPATARALAGASSGRYPKARHEQLDLLTLTER